jgi:hypothetical protein
VMERLIRFKEWKFLKLLRKGTEKKDKKITISIL